MEDSAAVDRSISAKTVGTVAVDRTAAVVDSNIERIVAIASSVVGCCCTYAEVATSTVVGMMAVGNCTFGAIAADLVADRNCASTGWAFSEAIAVGC